MNVFEKIASEINEERKHKGKKVSITPQMVEETIENTWNEARKNRLSTSAQNGSIGQEIPINEELYSPVPTEQSLSQKIEDIDNQSRLALSGARNALSRANKAIERANKAIEEAQIATKKWKRNDQILTWLIIVVIISFLWWLYTCIISVQESTHTFYQKWLELEKKITEYDEKIKIIEEKHRKLEEELDEKISIGINKRIVEFLMKDKQIKITE